MAIQDRAINVLAQLQNNGIGNRPVCFVTHSMGGLLVKEMLLHAAEGHTNFASFASSTRGVVFLSTPHTGSGLARTVDALKTLYRGTQAVKDLKRDSAHLRHLNDRYRDWCDDVKLRNLVLSETHSTKGVRVVDAGSANPGLAGIRPIPVDANHLDISRPSDRSSVVYGQVKRFLIEVRDSPKAAGAEIGNLTRSPAGPVSAALRIPMPLLLPIAELDPFDLEVHPAISPESDMAELSALPIYVERSHDLQLREIVKLAESGKNAIGVLVGSSSSGKTRAAWEAVRQLSSSWSLWHPLSPARPQAVLDGIEQIPPRTVVWLNELQHYLFTSSPELGEQVAASLRTILRDDRRAPILILGTIWPEYLSKLPAVPVAGEIDLHSQVRSLVGTKQIVVPPRFTPAELRTIHKTADPRLRQALAHSSSGEIAQYLAGAPALLERYEAAPAVAQAVVKVSVDAQRLGYTADLSRLFLERAAAGYLSDNEWQAVDDDWLDQALEYTSGRCRGAGRLLAQFRLRPGQGIERQTDYRLADYIAQWGRKARCFEIPPNDFWEAGLEHVSTAEALVSLGDAAAARWRIRYAALLYQRAIDFGEPAALLRMGELEEERGNIDQAHKLFHKGAIAGILPAQLKLADGLRRQGKLTDAKYWLRLAADQGEYRALQSLAQIAEDEGSETEAVALLQEAVEVAKFESSGPLRELARLREKNGAIDEAQVLREQARKGIQTVTRRSLNDIAERSGGAAALKQELQERVSKDRAEGGRANYMELELLAEIYEADGELHESEAVADLAAEQGSPSALLALVAVRANKGHYRDAERLARKAADAGDSWGLRELARCCPEDDRLQRILKFGLEPNGQISPSSD